MGQLLRTQECPWTPSDGQRQALVDLTLKGPSRRRRKARVKVSARVAAAAAAAGVCFALYSLSLSPRYIGFTVGESPTLAREGTWVRTGAEETTRVRFDGGSRFDFVPSTKARVVEAKDRRVTIDLEQGEVLADVAPRSKTSWAVRAGPYVVTVKGTRFSVHWSDPASMLLISVDRGRVLVEGPGIGETGMMIVAGKSLRAEADVGRVTFEPTKVAERTAVPAPGGADPSSRPAAEPRDVRPTAPAKANPIRATKAARRAPRTWQQLYHDRAYKEAIEAAAKQGVLSDTRRMKEADLWILSNAARYARRADIASDLLEGYRSRFPNHARAYTAAFLLGKSAFEQGTPQLAKRWFEVYLAEAPSGPLAEEALGRLINVYSRLGQMSHAERVARTYLKTYRGGYFTKQAEKVISLTRRDRTNAAK